MCIILRMFAVHNNFGRSFWAETHSFRPFPVKFSILGCKFSHLLFCSLRNIPPTLFLPIFGQYKPFTVKFKRFDSYVFLFGRRIQHFADSINKILKPSIIIQPKYWVVWLLRKLVKFSQYSAGLKVLIHKGKRSWF